MVSAVGHGTTAPKTCTSTAKQAQKLAIAAPKTCTGTGLSSLKISCDNTGSLITNPSKVDAFLRLMELQQINYLDDFIISRYVSFMVSK